MTKPEASNFRRRRTRRYALHAARALLISGLVAGAAADAGASAEPPSEPLAQVRAAAEDWVRSQLHAVAGVHVRAAALDARLHLAYCAGGLVAALAGTQLNAHTTVRVSCEARRTTWALYVPVSIDSDISVLVLRQGAARGTRLTPAQVVAETRRVAGLAAGYLTDTSVLEHRTLARSLPAGTALTADALLPDCIVRQGQAVTLIASAPGIEVRAPARALEDGHEGARVRVQNLASLKVVQGTVDASGLIYVTP